MQRGPCQQPDLPALFNPHSSTDHQASAEQNKPPMKPKEAHGQRTPRGTSRTNESFNQPDAQTASFTASEYPFVCLDFSRLLLDGLLLRFGSSAELHSHPPRRLQQLFVSGQWSRLVVDPPL